MRPEARPIDLKNGIFTGRIRLIADSALKCTHKVSQSTSRSNDYECVARRYFIYSLKKTCFEGR